MAGQSSSIWKIATIIVSALLLLTSWLSLTLFLALKVESAEDMNWHRRWNEDTKSYKEELQKSAQAIAYAFLEKQRAEAKAQEYKIQLENIKK